MSAVLPSVEIALLLGLRHGLVPDHLAAIDGLTMRARPAAAPWMGAIFSLGHGAVMLALVALTSLASLRLEPGPATLQLLDAAEWLPGFFLIGLAAINARALLMAPRSTAASVATGGVLSALFPSSRTTVGPAFALGVGMMFALGVESVLQAGAWGYAAESFGAGRWSALQVAAGFVLGMTITDALDGFATARIAVRAGPSAIRAFRRRLGWPIVILCGAAGLQSLGLKVCAACAPQEHWMSIIGMAIVAFTIAMYIVAVLKSLRRSDCTPLH